MPRSTAATLLIATLCGAPPAFGQCPSPAQSPAGLTVTGNATVDQKPELAVVVVTLTTRGATLADTSRAHEARIAQASGMLEALKAEGVVVRQGTFGLTEERRPVGPGVPVDPAKPPTYLARTDVRLSVMSLDRLDGIVGRLVGGGLFEVWSAQFSVRDDGEARDRARRGAVADARRQAETYADAAGVKLDGIQSITDGAVRDSGGAADFPLRSAVPTSVGITPPEVLHFTGDVVMTWRVAPR